MPDRGLTIQRLETVKRVLVRRHMTEEAETIGDALELLKEQDEWYKAMVVEWLREMAHNNYQEVRKMNFLDAILEIRERATIGLENYFKDYKKGKGGEWDD